MKKFFYICLLLIITSCVSKSDYEKLESDYHDVLAEKQHLKMQLTDLREDYYTMRIDYDKMVQAKKREEIERNRKQYVSESTAIKYIRDYYEFYKSETTPRDIKLKRTDKNSFVVSLKESMGGFEMDVNLIYHLLVNSDNTYTLRRTAY